MKKILYKVPALLAASLLMLTSCSDDESVFADGLGTVSIKASLSGDVKVESRADADQLRDLYGESLEVWITKPGQGPVRRYIGLDRLPTTPVTLPSGSYVAEAWAGDSVSASFEARYFKGFVPFEVVKGTSNPVDVRLKIANVVVSADVDKTVDDVLSGYTLTVGHSRGSLVFEDHDQRKGYFMMPSTDTDLTLTLEGTGIDGRKYTQTEVIADARPATEYIVHISHTPKDNGEIGGAFFTITVDATEILVEDEFTLTLAPDIKGVGFNIAEPQIVEPGVGVRKSVYITAADRLTALELHSDDFAALLPDGRKAFDLLNATDNTYEQALAAAGITVKRIMTDGVLTNVRVNFEETYTTSLADGLHTYEFVARDGELESAATLTFDVTSAPVALLPAADVAFVTATLQATVTKESTGEKAGFNYRKTSAAEWTFVEGTVAGGTMTARLEGLTDGATYQFTATYNGFETAPQQFTTRVYPQLPNAGFESWSKPGKPYLVYGSGQEMFWDTGNHGSTTLSADGSITTPDATVKHSGNYSARLRSTFVGFMGMGALAAGNVFTGQYLATEGMGGKLGWGRQFDLSGHPKALKGYVKYSPVAVTHQKDNPAGKAKGDMDEGIIYFALLTDQDDPRGTEYAGWPVFVNTNTQQLFDSKASNVVAYGEKVFTEATPGDGMIEFTITLNDVNPSLEATRILVVAAASRYGDYFTGGSRRR